MEAEVVKLESGAAAREETTFEAYPGQETEEDVDPPDGRRRQALACNRQCIRAAYERKKEKYQELAQAIAGLLREPGWKVELLPWVAGTRGVLDATGIREAMTFLEIPA